MRVSLKTAEHQADSMKIGAELAVADTMRETEKLSALQVAKQAELDLLAEDVASKEAALDEREG